MLNCVIGEAKTLSLQILSRLNFCIRFNFETHDPSQYMYLLPLWWLCCTIYLSIRSRKLHIIYKDFNSQCFLRTLVLSTQLLTQGPQIQQNWKSAGRNALIMKIFNNWHQTLIFLLMTEVTHEQRQGSALCCRNLACPLQGLIPSTSTGNGSSLKGAQTS